MTLEAYPGGPTFPPLKRAIVDAEFLASEYDKNPDGAPVEYGAQWANTLDQYLRDEFVRRMFSPYNGQRLHERHEGGFVHEFYAHGDPALSGDNFAFVIAHGETDDEGGLHVIVDRIDVWSPDDFADREIDHTMVESVIKDRMLTFPMVEVTFDHWNSALVIQRLRKFAAGSEFNRRRPTIRKVDTTAESKRAGWETFKNALTEGRIHSYPHELAQLELLFLRRNNRKIEAPTTGPCTTDDVATAIMNAAVRILSREDPGRQLADLPLRASTWGPASVKDQEVFDRLGGFGGGRGFQHGERRMSRRGRRGGGGRFGRR
jgi:hypothetical protein